MYHRGMENAFHELTEFSSIAFYYLILFFLAITPVMIISDNLKRGRKRAELLRKYGYSKDPVFSITELIREFQKNNFYGVQRIVGNRIDFLRTKDEYAIIFEFYKTHLSRTSSSSRNHGGLVAAIASTVLTSYLSQRYPERALIAHMSDGTYRIGYGLMVISDKKLHDFYERAQQFGVIIEDQERTAGTLF
jgi:hypothetical protein